MTTSCYQRLTLSPDASAKQVAGQLAYHRAIGDDGLIAIIDRYRDPWTTGIDPDPIDVLTNSWAVGPRLVPIIRTRLESLRIDGGITVQDARVESWDRASATINGEF